VGIINVLLESFYRIVFLVNVLLDLLVLILLVLFKITVSLVPFVNPNIGELTVTKLVHAMVTAKGTLQLVSFVNQASMVLDVHLALLPALCVTIRLQVMGSVLGVLILRFNGV